MFCIPKRSLVFILFLTCLLDHASADSLVQINISDKVIANAAFYQGEAEKPVILILHGFMLTHNFPIVKRLANSLHESGYTVLTPTLSLDINKRKKSLACEAIHTHSLESDTVELDLWVKWLKKKTGKKVSLIGHSIGSLHLAYYLSHQSGSNVEQIIFITMPDMDPGAHNNKTVALREKAMQLISKKNNSLYNFELLYCKKYPTFPQNFLSYSNLSKENISKYLKNINIKKSLILGTSDKIIDKQWNKELTQYDIDIITIDGADHFFDYEYEFDLLDSIENIFIKQIDSIKEASHFLKKKNEL